MNKHVSEAVFAGFKARLRTYQHDWVRTAIGNKLIAHLGSRQIGKDVKWSGWAVLRSMLEPGCEWSVYNATQAKAQEFLADCKRWYAYLAHAWIWAGSTPPTPLVNNKGEFALSNGSVIRSRPGTVRATVGIRQNVILNEIAVIPHAEKLYDAAFPPVQQAWINGLDAQMIVISNASAVGTWWNEHVENIARKGKGGWKLIQSTWEDSMARWGMRPRVLRAWKKKILGSVSIPAFKQWYECIFRADGGGWYSPELLTRQGFDPIMIPNLYDLPRTIGYDIGQTRHPYALAEVHVDDAYEYVRGTHHDWDVLYDGQRNEIKRRAKRGSRVSKVIADSTGQGTIQTQELRKLLSDIGVPVVDYSFSREGNACHEVMRDRLDQGLTWIDAGDLDLRMQLESVDTKIIGSGIEKVRIPEQRVHHNGATRILHGDRAVSAAMGVWGAVSSRSFGGVITPTITPLYTPTVAW